MQGYYQQRGACFTPDSVVYTPNGPISCSEARKGTLLQTSSGFSKVECVVISTGDFRVFRTETAGFTENHPVFVNNTWKLAREVFEPSDSQTNSVVNFVMEDRSCIVVGGVLTATLGHGISGDVVGHEYYGTERVVEDLKNEEGWENGRVVV